MTTYYVDSVGGSNANNGLTPATAKQTLNGVEDVPVVAGDRVIAKANSTFRETLTVDVSGGNTYSTGTVSVTNGSAVVTGSGTTFTGNVAADYIFQSSVQASGTDGVTTAVTATSHTFTSAAGNFQAGHIGKTIRINTIGAYIITAVASATSITIAKPDNSSFLMVAGTGLTYNVGPEAPYEILSVDSNTQITLTKAWEGPTLTGIAYLTHNPVRYIGDYKGVLWGDGISGPVRITGSDNDQTASRNNCISATSKNYRIFTGFTFDTNVSGLSIIAMTTACSNWIIEKCIFNLSLNGLGPSLAGTGINNTIRNCAFMGGASNSSLNFTHTSTVDNIAGLVENCIFNGGTRNVGVTRAGGIIVKNCVTLSRTTAGFVNVQTALTVGQAVTVNNCVISNQGVGLNATAVGEIIENYNNFYGNATDRTNVLTGPNSNGYPPLFDTRWFFQMVNAGAGPNSAFQLASPFDLASYSQLVNVAGTGPTATDMRGTAVIGAQREWGALEYDSSLKIKGQTARARSLIGIG